MHRVKTMEEGLKLLLSVYGNEREKPFVFTSSDNGASILDANYEKLKDKFYFLMQDVRDVSIIIWIKIISVI